MITPVTSIRKRPIPRDSGMRNATAVSARTTIGTLMRKTEPHQK